MIVILKDLSMPGFKDSSVIFEKNNKQILPLHPLTPRTLMDRGSL